MFVMIVTFEAVVCLELCDRSERGGECERPHVCAHEMKLNHFINESNDVVGKRYAT